MKKILFPMIMVLLIVVITGSQTTFAKTPDCVHDNCTHDQWLSYLMSSYPDGAMVPVIVSFKNQLTPEEIKAGMTINSTGRFDIEGEVKLIESYGGKIYPNNRIEVTNFLGAYVPKDRVFDLANDPEVSSIDIDSSSQAAVIISPNGRDVYYPNGTVIHIPNPSVNSTSNDILESISIKDVTNIHTKTLVPPLKQFKSGITAEDVICKDGHQLVLKLRDNSPACVKPIGVAKLVAWGWAKLPA